MYTSLLLAALAEVPPPSEEERGEEDREVIFAEVLQRRRALSEDVPAELRNTEAVPVVLARQIGYDVSLIRLAACVGVETDPGRFEPTGRERSRLEQVFRDLGLGVGPTAWSGSYGDR